MTTPDPYQPPQDYPATGIQPNYPGGPAYSAAPESALPSPYFQTSAYPADAPVYPPPVYPPPGYPQSAYGSPVGYPGARPRNGLGTAALVCGIIAIPLDLTFYGGVVLGILAIVFGGVGLGRAKRGEATNRGQAQAGLILGIVALALLVLLIVVAVGSLAAFS